MKGIIGEFLTSYLDYEETVEDLYLWDKRSFYGTNTTRASDKPFLCVKNGSLVSVKIKNPDFSDFDEIIGAR